MNTTTGPAPENPIAAAAAPRAIAVWLFACCGMVILMMLIGAITRLTESGLSMVEWRPLIGVLPPLSDEEWKRVFALYRVTSEYRLQNPDMTLGAFKTIFWWEYIHRVWGRLIGVVFAVPLLWFVIRRQIPKGLTPHLVGLFLLGGFQGVIGWWMVKSGFVDREDVSQYRLTAHLGIAFVILGYMLWIAIGLMSRARAEIALPAGLGRNANAVLLVTFVTALTGGLVAGLNAGFTYNEWPMMDGRFVPEGYGELTPWWLNLFDNIAAVQFDHRIMAYLTAAGVLALWLQARRGRLPAGAQRPFHVLAALVAVQIALGIATLLMVVPLPLAVLHQGGAIALFCAAVWTAQAVSR
jgi:cytochrome c oxidase assembly protein subunit 15